MKQVRAIAALLLWMTAIVLASPAGAQNYNWTGFYVGAQAGLGKPRDVVRYGGSSTGDPYNDDNEKINHREDGFVGGVQAGYNLQLGFLVPGVEADFGYMGFNGSRFSPPQYDPNQETRAVSSGGLFGTVTGRLGIAIDRALLYTKGGFAYARPELGVDDNVPPLTTDTRTRKTFTGWTIGGGLEYAIGDHWTLKSEYQFMDLGRKSISGVASDGVTDRWKHEVTAHIIKLAFNFKF